MVTEVGNQHGYLPGKGILTAWTSLTKMLTKPNIFEADYEGFFNNVTHLGLYSVMRDELKLPKSELLFLLKLNKSLVKLTADDKLEEKERVYPFGKFGEPNPQSDPSKDPRLNSIPAYMLHQSNLMASQQEALSEMAKIRKADEATVRIIHGCLQKGVSLDVAVDAMDDLFAYAAKYFRNLNLDTKKFAAFVLVKFATRDIKASVE